MSIVELLSKLSGFGLSVKGKARTRGIAPRFSSLLRRGIAPPHIRRRSRIERGQAVVQGVGASSGRSDGGKQSVQGWADVSGRSDGGKQLVQGWADHKAASSGVKQLVKGWADHQGAATEFKQSVQGWVDLLGRRDEFRQWCNAWADLQAAAMEFKVVGARGGSFRAQRRRRAVGAMLGETFMRTFHGTDPYLNASKSDQQ